MKLELKHLAPYLPYRLKGETITIYGKINYPKKAKVITELTVGNIWNYGGKECPESKKFKPILKPLLDLNKPCPFLIDLSFVEWCCIPTTENPKIDDLIKAIECKKVNALIWDSLFREHFDVFGLIEKGLAIDINTLKQD